MRSDGITPYGQGSGLGYYLIRQADSYSEYTTLVAIDELGNVTDTHLRGPADDAAPTRGDAIKEHLASAIKDAEASLERRRQKLAAEPPKEPDPEPIDPATARFHYDPDY